MVEIHNLYKVYDEGKNSKLTALKGVNFSIEQGDMIAIVGVSGSGKTTLMNIVGLMDTDYSGEYKWNGRDTRGFTKKECAEFRNKRIGFVVQDFALVENYTVKQNMEIPLDYAKEKKSREVKTTAIEQCLEKLGIKDKINVPVCKLSGGQRQRVAVARAIINDPDLILADEPTGALDRKNTMEIMELFTALNKDGKTIMIITHDNKVADYCRSVYQIEDGNLRKQVKS